MPIDAPRAAERMKDEAQIAKRYFGSFAADYHRAFEGTGRQPFHALINSLFRRKTFQRRTDVVRAWLREDGVAGKHVLELGCGSGEVSIAAAQLGARVTGLDIVPEMIAIARQGAADAGVADAATFRVHSFVDEAIEPADVVMMIGVIEYYRDLDDLIPRVAAAARESLIIVDTRGPWWRRALRYALARAKHFHLYYHAPDRVAALAAREGLAERARVAGHSYTAFWFRRPAAER
jgi:2-polyprenyl-3-methyl-5-hydroxy-6-metoxy-1,4-benzoquinol methylase